MKCANQVRSAGVDRLSNLALESFHRVLSDIGNRIPNAFVEQARTAARCCDDLGAHGIGRYRTGEEIDTEVSELR